MADPRLISEIIDEILVDLREIRQRCDTDCENVILTCKEAASYLGKTPQTISSYIAQGRLHKVSNGVKVGISKTELRKLKQRQTSFGVAGDMGGVCSAPPKKM